MVEAGGSIQGLSGPSEIGAKCMVMGAAPGTIGGKSTYFYFASVRGPEVKSRANKQAGKYR